MSIDGGPEIASREFGECVEMWKIEPIKSSPRYSQSNGKAENAVKSCKGLFKKVTEDREKN